VAEPPELVGDIFRALAPIVQVRPQIRTVAMPIVGAGEQRYPIEAMLEPVHDAATHWLEAGLSLDRLAIVTHSEDSLVEAARIFGAFKASRVAAPAVLTGDRDYDVFISNAHENSDVMGALVAELRAQRPGIRVFVDRHEPNVGAAWQIQIFESLERSRKVVAVLSPAYLASKACQEEFSSAWIRGNDAADHVLFPVYALSTQLPAYVRYLQSADAREADATKLKVAAAQVLRAVDLGRSMDEPNG
jgi:TIR domain